MLGRAMDVGSVNCSTSGEKLTSMPLFTRIKDFHIYRMEAAL